MSLDLKLSNTTKTDENFNFTFEQVKSLQLLNFIVCIPKKRRRESNIERKGGGGRECQQQSIMHEM